MKIPLLSLSLLVCVLAGCANTRYVQVVAPRPVNGVADSSVHCTPEKAVELFREAAGKLKLQVRGPVVLSGTQTEYVAQGVDQKGGILLLIEPKQISVVVNITGDDEAMQEAWRVATLVEGVFVEHGHRPRVEVRNKALAVK